MKVLFLTCFAVSFLYSQNSDEQVFRLAQAFEQAGEIERAADLYQSLYLKDSLNYGYFDALKRSFIQLKKYPEALALSYSRFRKMPYDFTLQAGIGSIYYIAGRELQSDSVWNLMLTSANKNQMIYRAVANEQVNVRLFEKAVQTFRKGRLECGDPLLFANELAYYYSFMMDYGNATREYLLLLKMNEMQLEYIQSRIGQFTSKPDGLTAATKVLEEEVKVESGRISFHRLLLWLYMEGIRYNDAFTIARTIEQKINSGGAEIFSFAERVFRERAYAVAASAYQLALANGPKMQFVPMAKYGYARCVEELLNIGDTTFHVQKPVENSMLETQPTFNEAVRLYDALSKEYPFSNVSANALYRIGMIRYKQLFDLDGAVHMFDSVLTIAPGGPLVATVLSTLGEIYISKGMLPVAATKYILMKNSPFSTPVQQNVAQYKLAEIQFFQNNFDSTLSLLQSFTQNLKADESNDALLLQAFLLENTASAKDALKQYARAVFLFRQQKVTEAITDLQDLIIQFPSAPLCDDALLLIAEYSIQVKRYGDALTAYQKIIEAYPKSIEREKTLFKIAELYQYNFRDQQKAIQSYEAVLERYPFSLFADEARKRIRILRGDNL